MNSDDKPKYVPYQRNEDDPNGPALPLNPSIVGGRTHVMVEPQAYISIQSKEVLPTIPPQPEVVDVVSEETNAPNNEAEKELFEEMIKNEMGYTEDEFNKLAQSYQNEDGKFLVMTEFGAVEVPEEHLKNVPSELVRPPIERVETKFGIKPVYHERVHTKTVIERHHTIIEKPTLGVVDRIVPMQRAEVVEVPRYRYKGVTVNKKIEHPEGVAYFETPITVHLPAPPRLVAVPADMSVSRKIRVVRPIVQERIVEVPKYIKDTTDRPYEVPVEYAIPSYVREVNGVAVPTLPPPQLAGKGFVDDEHYVESIVPDASTSYGRFTSRYTSVLTHTPPELPDETHIISVDGYQLRIGLDGKTLVHPDGAPYVSERGEVLEYDPKVHGYMEEIVRDEAVHHGNHLHQLPTEDILAHAKDTGSLVHKTNIKLMGGEPKILSQRGQQNLSKYRNPICYDNSHELIPPLSQNGGVPLDLEGSADYEALDQLQQAYGGRRLDMLHQQISSSSSEGTSSGTSEGTSSGTSSGTSERTSE